MAFGRTKIFENRGEEKSENRWLFGVFCNPNESFDSASLRVSFVGAKNGAVASCCEI